MIPKRIILLHELLNSQDNVATETPLFCVHERDTADCEEDASGRLVAMFLTGEGADWYIRAFKHRLSYPFVYVRGPGEGSDIHHLIKWFRGLDIETLRHPSTP